MRMATKLKRETDATDSTTPKTAPKVTTIRARILRRILPVALVPLLVLGALAIAGIFLIQQRTTDAVESAEEILTQQVVEDTATRASEQAARELADYVDQWIFRANRLNSQASFRESVVQVSNDTRAADIDEMTEAELEEAMTGPTTTRTQVLALTVEEELRTFEDNIQVLLVSEEGFRLGSTSDETQIDYSQAQWFNRAVSDGSSYRSFVDDGEGPAAFEIALWTEPPATTRGGAVLRIRVPLSNAQWILDEIAGDDSVQAALIDTSASVLLADTSSAHDPSIVFDQSSLMTAASGANVNLLNPGVVQDDVNVTSARRVSDRMDNVDNVRFNWLVQTSQPIDIAAASLVEVQSVADDVSELRQYLVYGVFGLVLLALILAFFAVRSVANRITRPVNALAKQAQSAADEGIPAVVEAARTSEELPELPEFDVNTNDELTILANSMNTMQEAAVDLAAGQAKLRRQNVARTFVSLGRRNQNLLNRQLEFIDELEQQESDADALENLFRLDHLATRMRRNAENLLVLAGEQTPRRWGKPIAVRDVLRAAAAEIADYRRVRLGEIDKATVSGNLATDLSHLIAELLENAGSFSPPNTPIEVLGQHTSTHYRLAIVDQGIGMDPQALAQVNDRLKNPVDFADAPSAYLGLFVVGRLAQELGITVRLASADPTGEGRRRGTIAFIDMPVALLSSAEASPIEINQRTSEGVAHRTEQLDAAQQQPTAEVVAPAATAAPAHTPLPSPVAREATTGTTAAGFPKRSRGATSVPDTPAVMTPSQPAEAPPLETPALTSPPIPSNPPATEITAAGFPKRSGAASSNEPVAAPAPAPMPATTMGPAPKRDAAEVSNSLRSIRAAVARGRASGATEAPPTPAPAPTAAPAQPPVAPAAPAAPVAPVAPAQAAQPVTQPVPQSAPMPAPVVANLGSPSLSPPPVPIAPTAESAPTPETPGAAQPAPQAPVSNQPTQTGSES